MKEKVFIVFVEFRTIDHRFEGGGYETEGRQKHIRSLCNWTVSRDFQHVPSYLKNVVYTKQPTEGLQINATSVNNPTSNFPLNRKLNKTNYNSQ